MYKSKILKYILLVLTCVGLLLCGAVIGSSIGIWFARIDLAEKIVISISTLVGGVIMFLIGLDTFRVVKEDFGG